MASVKDHKEMGGEFLNEEVTLRVMYDFARDGGAIGTLDLFTANSACVLTYAHAAVKTAVTSGGSATVEVGYTGDTDALVTAKAPAALTLGALVAEDGAFTSPKKLAAGDKVTLTIATAALTAGQVEVVVKYMAF